MKSIKIGKYAVPLWLIAGILISGIGGTLGYYVWKTLTVQVEVKEPIEVLQYPSSLSLYPGETKEFNVTVDNHASINYSVVLDFQLGNTTYQDIYTTFSNEIYAIVSGQQNLTAWIQVRADAPAMNTSLTISFARGIYPSGLVGFWRFDEGKGDIAFDSSGNDNHGILVNGPAWVNGKQGKALSFDGIDDYAMIPDSPSLRVQSFTLAAWIYMTKRPYQHGDVSSAIINKISGLGGPGTKGYKLMFEGPTSSNDHLVISVGDGISQRFLIDYNSINDLTLNNWHHVVGTYDVTIARIYIDGELKASAPAIYVVINDDAPLGIGQEVTAIPAGPGHFNGLVDSAMIYDRALTSQETKAEYTGSLP